MFSRKCAMLKRREFLTSMCGLGIAALAPWALFADSPVKWQRFENLTSGDLWVSMDDGKSWETWKSGETIRFQESFLLDPGVGSMTGVRWIEA